MDQARSWPTSPEDWKKILAWIVRRKFAPAAAARASFPREAAKVFAISIRSCASLRCCSES